MRNVSRVFVGKLETRLGPRWKDNFKRGLK
jgi:hypothetical protein